MDKVNEEWLWMAVEKPGCQASGLRLQEKTEPQRRRRFLKCPRAAWECFDIAGVLRLGAGKTGRHLDRMTAV
jgi:hypothetical protein